MEAMVSTHFFSRNELVSWDGTSLAYTWLDSGKVKSGKETSWEPGNEVGESGQRPYIWETMHSAPNL